MTGVGLSTSTHAQGGEHITVQIGLIVIAALAWFAAAEVSLAFSFSDIRLAPVWFASGLALASVYLLGIKSLIGLVPAAFVANVLYTLNSGEQQGMAPYLSATGIALGEGVAAWWGAGRLKRVFPNREVLSTARNMWRFTLIVLMSSLISAVIGTASVYFSGLVESSRIVSVLHSWWLADLAGAIVLIPALVSLSRTQLSQVTARQWLESLASIAVLSFTLSYLFSPYATELNAQLITFLVMPFAVWSVFRVPQAAICLFLLLTALLVCFATTSGYGPFVTASSELSLRAVQLFVLSLALVVLSLKAGVNERRAISLELKRTNQNLEQRVLERTSELSLANTELAQSMSALKSAARDRRVREERVRELQEVALKLSTDERLFAGSLEHGAVELAQTAAKALKVERVSVWQAAGIHMVSVAIVDAQASASSGCFDTREYEDYIHALENSRVLSARDARSDPRTHEFKQHYLEPLGIVALLDAPIRSATLLRGVVCVESRGAPRDWDADEQGFVAVLGDIMGQLLFANERREALKLAHTENLILSTMSDPSRMYESVLSITELLVEHSGAAVALVIEIGGERGKWICDARIPLAVCQALQELDASAWTRACEQPAGRIDLSAPSQVNWQQVAATEGFVQAQLCEIRSPRQAGRGVLLLLGKSPFSDVFLATTLTRAMRLLSLAVGALSQHAATQASELRYRALYDDNPSMYLTLDGRAQILSVNAFGAQRLGFVTSDLVACSFGVLADQMDLQEFRKSLARLAQTPQQLAVRETPLRMASGERLWARLSMRARHTESGHSEFLLTCEDLTETRALATRLRHQAEHDLLTGLKNRQSLERAIAHGIEGVARGEAPGALIYLDLDQFKVINDTLGHGAGDELLRQITRVFKQCMPLTALLGRVGGDEFAAVLYGLSIERASALAEDLRSQLERFRFRMDTHALQITASLSVVPIDAHARDVAQVLSAADTACYAAKETGRNRVVQARHDDSELKRRRIEMQWISKLNRAFDEDLFELYFQPIAQLSNPDAPSEYELLLRMRSSTGEMYAPDQFLRAAERFGMGPRIDRFVVGRCFEELANHPAHLSKLGCCAINLSGHSLGFPEFFDDLLTSLRRHQIPPEKICFEVTETAAIANLSVAESSIRKLSAIGFRFALDDFGSGFSSFAYLKTLPIDTLKIDGNFVRDMLTDPLDYAVVKSIQEVARAMGKRTIAEYVESGEILDALRTLGVDAVQGFFIGRPQPWRAMLKS